MFLHLPWPQTLSKVSLLPDRVSYGEYQSIFGRSKSEPAATAAANQGSKTWPSFPCSLSFEIDGKIHVSCVNWHKCGRFEEERSWHGRIVGNGLHGSLNALLIKYKNRILMTRTPLMELLTICAKCRGEPHSCDSETVKGTCGTLILSILDEEIDEFLASKEVIMEGILMDVIRTFGEDKKKKEWYMWRPLFNVW